MYHETGHQRAAYMGIMNQKRRDAQKDQQQDRYWPLATMLVAPRDPALATPTRYVPGYRIACRKIRDIRLT
jgi:hypothetical protein